MHKLDWDDIRHFLQVVRSGSASHAAEQLGVNHTTVYRRISALESKLGKSLFERANNGWAITPVGERIIAFAETMAENANSIERQVFADSHELNGILRVTAADHCADQLLMPAIKKFVQRYPEVQLEYIATADELDLSARESDVALRGTDEPPPNLVGTRISQIGFAVYATDELKQRALENPLAVDLPCVTWVGDSHSRPAWIEKNFPNTRRIYRSTSFSAMHAMAREGIGIASLACVIADPDIALQRVPVPVLETGPSLWVLSHVDLRTTARVRIFRDFLVDELKKKKALIEGKLGEQDLSMPAIPDSAD